MIAATSDCDPKRAFGVEGIDPAVRPARPSTVLHGARSLVAQIGYRSAPREHAAKHLVA